MADHLTPEMAAYQQELRSAIMNLNWPTGPIVNSISEHLAGQVIDAIATVPHPEVERLRHLMDTYLPTILTGLAQAVRTHERIDRDDLTVEQMALRAALSAAHGMAKQAAALPVEDEFDLPSLLDVTAQRDRARAALADALTAHGSKVERLQAQLDATAGVLGETRHRVRGLLDSLAPETALDAQRAQWVRESLDALLNGDDDHA